ncbi:Acb2/Tad1 domain-containing protein [Parabacteroides johnsonii]
MTRTEEVVANKQLRKDIDEKIQEIKNLPPSRERSLAITKLQEGVMWLGMDLKRLNEDNPYPSSKDPSSGDKIEPTADGSKL